MERAKEETGSGKIEHDSEFTCEDSIERRCGKSCDTSPDQQNVSGLKADTIAGTEYGPGGSSVEIVDRNPSILSAVESGPYTCEEVGCVWACDHHVHEEHSADFLAGLDDVAFHAGFGCSFCKMFKDISVSRCACMLAEEAPERPHEVHPCQYLHAKFSNRVVSIVTFLWSCAVDSTVDLELVSTDDVHPFPTIQGSVHLDRVSEESVALYKDWIRNCTMYHKPCVGHSESYNPRRLLDVGECDGLPGVKLCHGRDRFVQYIALSYCWGGKQPLMTRKWNLSDHEHYICWAVLPKSYQDTIILARKLGVRYVWIDSLCLVQDDDEEKDVDIAQMHNIFRNAFLVVIAAQAKSSYAGYLDARPNSVVGRQRARHCWQDFVVRYRELGLVTVKVRDKLLAHKTQLIDACAGVFMTIDKRAWTYQERLLARRCIIFQGQDVVWECKTGCYCACSGDRSVKPGGTQYNPQLLPVINTPRPNKIEYERVENYFSNANEAYQFWREAVQNFSPRALSHPTDRLPAISALASVVHHATYDEYLAGLWKGDLAAQLLWYNWPAADDEIEPYGSYVAPSWSWASIRAPTKYKPPCPPHIQLPPCSVEVLEAACTLSGKNPFGPVTDGYLILKAVHCRAHAAISISTSTNSPTIRLVLENRLIHSAEETSSEFLFLDGHRVTSTKLLLPSGDYRTVLQRQGKSSIKRQPSCSGEVRLLWIEQDECLILAHSRRVTGAFERIGLLTGYMAPSPPEYPPSVIKLV